MTQARSSAARAMPGQVPHGGRCHAGAGATRAPRGSFTAGAIEEPDGTATVLWSGRRESNPRSQFGRLGLYH